MVYMAVKTQPKEEEVDDDDSDDDDDDDTGVFFQKTIFCSSSEEFLFISKSGRGLYSTAFNYIFMLRLVNYLFVQ